LEGQWSNVAVEVRVREGEALVVSDAPKHKPLIFVLSQVIDLDLRLPIQEGLL